MYMDMNDKHIHTHIYINKNLEIHARAMYV